MCECGISGGLINIFAPKVVVLDISCESHEELVECIDDIAYAKKAYGSDTSYAIYTLIED